MPPTHPTPPHPTPPAPRAACFTMPHAAFLGLSIACALLFLALSGLFALIETGATEPLSRNLLSLASECLGLGRAGGWLACEGAARCSCGFVGACLFSRGSRPPCSAIAHAAPIASMSRADGSHFILRRAIKFALPLVPVALQTVPRWEVGASGRAQKRCGKAGNGSTPALVLTVQPPCTRCTHHSPTHSPTHPLQGWVNFLLVSWFLYITVRRAPYHRTWLNVGEAFLYAWVWWAAGLALIGIYYPAVSSRQGGAGG